MFLITGTVENIFRQPGGTGKDGKPYAETLKVQIKGTIVMKNGDSRVDLVTLTVPQNRLKEIQDMQGHTVTLPCGVFASGGKITPFLTA